MKKIRLSLDVTPEMKKIIEDLASPEGITQGEVLRRAIALFRTAKQAQEAGEELVAIKNGKILYKLVGY